MVKIQVETTSLRNSATPVLVLLWRDCTIAAHGLKTSVGVALGYNKEDEATALLNTKEMNNSCCSLLEEDSQLVRSKK